MEKDSLVTLDHSVLFRRSTTATGLIMAVFVFLVDQITKFMIVHYLGLEQHGSIELLPFLSFTWTENTGVAMSLLVAHDDIGRWSIVALTVIISVAVCWLLMRTVRRPEAIAFGVILGGAIGNLTDRIRLGYVVDFIHLHLGGWSFYVFNVADSAITFAVSTLVLFSLFRQASAAE